MEPHARSTLNAQIYEEASSWFIECRGGDLDDAGRRDFDRWLRKSPEHLSAYLEVAAIWNEGPSLDPDHRWNTEALVDQAAADSGSVVRLADALSPEAGSRLSGASVSDPPQSGADSAHIASRGRYGRLKKPSVAMAASMAVLATLAGVFILWSRLSAPVYATETGEQRSLEFADGSTVQLNSRSKIRVRYSEGERAVDLLEGQALFHVAKDLKRPFVVSADGTRVRAVGTQFDVYRKHGGTVVTVVEGRVAVLTNVDPAVGAVDKPVAGIAGWDPQSDAGSASVAQGTAPSGLTAGQAGGTIFLSAGEQLMVTRKEAQKSPHPNIAGATAWTQREIVFESATLSDVAEEFNRYNQRQLIIEDPGLYGFHISGVFSSTDPDALIKFLRERPGVRVTESGSEIRVAKNIS